MISFSEYNKFFKEAIVELQKIKEDMQRYKKLKTDLRGYGLIKDIDAKIKELTLANTAMNRDDLIKVYEKKDYTDYVNKIKAEIKEFRRICDHIKAFEKITDYYNDI